MITERSPLPPDFRFTLIATLPEHGQEVLDFAPDGWKGYASTWTRDEKYHGVYRTIETQLRFIRNGATFLRSEYNRHGVNATTRLLIEKLNYDALQYQTDFLGEFNFAQMTDGQNILSEDFVDMAVTEVGIVNLLRAREKNVYEIPLHTDVTGSRIHIVEPANAWMEARQIVDIEANMWTLNFGNVIERATGVAASITTASEISSNQLQINEIKATDMAIFQGLKIIEFDNSMRHPLNLKVRFSGEAQDLEHWTGFTIYLRLWKDGNIVLEKSDSVSEFQGYEKLDFNIEMDCGFTDQNMYCSIHFKQNTTLSASYERIKIFNALIEITGLSEPLLKPFSFRAISLYDAFCAIVRNIGGDEMPDAVAASELLKNGELSGIYLTSGDAIRDTRDSQDVPNAMLKTTFNDFFESIFAVYPVALEIHDAKTMNIIMYSEAYRRNVEILNVGEARSLKITPATARMFNQVTAGSADKDYKAANGRFEFNTENVFSLPLLRVASEKKLIPKYRTDSFGITDTKLSYEPKPTTTGSSDNDVFMIYTVAYGADRKPDGIPVAQYNQIKGDDIQLARKGVFNLFFTPQRCLRRHAAILSGLLHRADKTLAFQSTAKTDAPLLSQTGSEFINERGHYTVNADPVWKPDIYEIETKLPRNLVAEMGHAAKRGGFVRFFFREMVYRGFPMDIRQEHWANPAQTIKLLAHPDSPVAGSMEGFVNLVSGDDNLISNEYNLITGG